MASAKTISDVVGLLFDAPLANKPKPSASQTEADMINATARVFTATLRDIDDDLLKAAVVQHIGTSRWFPAVADLRETAVSLLHRADDVPDAYTAWSQIKRAMRGGPAPHPLALQAINALGGISEFGKSDIDDESSWRARFVSAYQTYQQRQAEDSMMPPAVAGYIAQRRELGGQSVAGLIGGITRQLMAATQ